MQNEDSEKPNYKDGATKDEGFEDSRAVKGFGRRAEERFFSEMCWKKKKKEERKTEKEGRGEPSFVERQFKPCSEEKYKEQCRGCGSENRSCRQRTERWQQLVLESQGRQTGEKEKDAEV